ncbi:hypothetical protein ACIP5Y_04745 [Nocardia sp. NPDC088792]|uniref:hypothetical protein n=1 Tax=Nocardia sp. NPDC088792 TaxID=3364332 RepID=UPI0037FBC0C1
MIFAYDTVASGEGANIRTWIGFKHFEYVVSDAIREYLTASGVDARQLIIDGGAFEVVASRVALTSVIELGDRLTVRIVELIRVAADRLSAIVEIDNLRSAQRALKGRYQILLTAPADDAGRFAPVLETLAEGPLAVAAKPRGGTLSGPETPAAADVFAHEWVVPYYYCERSEVLSYRGYVRTVETVVDEYLAHVGLAIPGLLAERAWIPVVAKYSFEILAPAPMGVRVRTFFKIEDVVGDAVFNASWATFAEQPAGWVCTARGEIQHGYAISRGAAAGSLARLDEATIKALTRGEPR